MFGVDEFTAIINPPQVAILAVGAVKKRPVVMDDELTVARTMKATLSSDHRLIDGVMAARFMKTLKELLEEPARMLI